MTWGPCAPLGDSWLELSDRHWLPARAECLNLEYTQEHPQAWSFWLQIPRLCPKVSSYLVWDGPPVVSQVPLLLLRHLHWRTTGSHYAFCVEFLALLLHCPLQVSLLLVTKLPVLLFRGLSSMSSLKAKIKANKWHRTNFYILVQAKSVCSLCVYEDFWVFYSVLCYYYWKDDQIWVLELWDIQDWVYLLIWNLVAPWQRERLDLFLVSTKGSQCHLLWWGTVKWQKQM